MNLPAASRRSFFPAIRSLHHRPCIFNASSLGIHLRLPRHRFASTSATSSGRLGRRLLYTAGGLVVGAATLVAVDNYFYAQSLGRTGRAFFYGALIALDYKLNFNPDNVDNIDALHTRVAKRLHYVCTKNGGGFIKLGQSLAIQASVLPKPYREAFATIFDAAPQIPYRDVEKVFKTEFGMTPDEAFEVFDHNALASASIAQVHRAKLRETGEWVAVKVQKPAIPLQIEWDLFSYRSLLYVYERIFDIPCYFIASYVTDQVRKETDFANEARNAERTRAYVEGEPSLRGKVVIPRVIHQWSSKRVMTAEWFEACRLTDKKSMAEWNLSTKEAMDIALSAFSAMIFSWGRVLSKLWVHCDPHPGNVLVRRHPDNPKKPQIILIDHGLYIPLSEKFRHEYSLLWRSLFAMDVDTIDRIARGWGIGNSDMFASATLLRPTRLRRKESEKAVSEQTPQATRQSRFEQQQSVKKLLKSLLQNEELIPREIIFITRCMRMMQANNQSLGSPSNRITMLAHWAVTGLATRPESSQFSSITPQGFVQRLRHAAQVWLFRFNVFLIDFSFQLSRIWQYFRKDEGFEDLLQKQLTGMARDELGIEIDDSAFSG